MKQFYANGGMSGGGNSKKYTVEDSTTAAHTH